MKFPYKKIADIGYWEEFLNRELNIQEKFLLLETKIENDVNNNIKLIHNFVKDKNLCIKNLTNMQGNCLFESLNYLNLFDENVDYRKIIFILLMIFKNEKLQDIFNCNDLLAPTLNDMFILTNEIKFVYCRNKNLVYKYDYDAMCFDVLGTNNWQRLPTELILRLFSLFFNLNINIVHNNQYITEIISNINNENKIFLGLIGENHYIPIVESDNNNENENECLKYKDSAKNFHRWAKSMCIKHNKIEKNSI